MSTVLAAACCILNRHYSVAPSRPVVLPVQPRQPHALGCKSSRAVLLWPGCGAAVWRQEGELGWSQDGAEGERWSRVVGAGHGQTALLRRCLPQPLHPSALNQPSACSYCVLIASRPAAESMLLCVCPCCHAASAAVSGGWCGGLAGALRLVLLSIVQARWVGAALLTRLAQLLRWAAAGAAGRYRGR